MTDDDLLIRVGFTEKQIAKQLLRMEAQANRGAKRMERSFERSNRNVVRGFERSSKAANSFSSNGLRNVSLQLSQVAQQGAVTGDYFRALAIQLPDLALGFGTIGIAAGALAPILLTLGQEFLFSGEKAEDFKKKLEEVAQVQKALDEQLRGTRLGVSPEELTILDAIVAKRKEIAEQERALADAEQTRARDTQALAADIATKRSAELNKQLGELQDQLQTIRRLQAEQASFTQRTVETSAAERALGEQMQTTGRELAENERIAQLLRDGIDASTIAGMQLAGVDMASGIDAASMAAARLASNLGIAYEAAVALQSASGGRGGNPLEMGGRPIDWQTAEAAEFLRNYKPPRPSRGGGGGGGGGGSSTPDPIIAELDRLKDTLATEEALQIASFEKQQETLQEALAKKLLTQQEHNALMEAAQEQHAARMSEIDVYRYGSGIQQAEQFFGDMASAFQGGSEKMQRVAQTFGAIEALINAYRAYNQVLADPSLPWFAKVSAAASVLGAGLKAVNAIKGAGSGGGGASGGSSSAAATQPQVSRNVAIQLQGSNFGQDQVRSLINEINEAVEDGAVLRIV